jgi:antirestriction protein ArdC
MKTDLYNKVTDQIVASLEQGVRPWMKPWSAEHASGRITRPLRANGLAYQGINVLVLWSDAIVKGYSAPLWMTFRQALELDAHVRKGERGSTVVYASKITRTGTDAETGSLMATAFDPSRSLSFAFGTALPAPKRTPGTAEFHQRRRDRADAPNRLRAWSA